MQENKWLQIERNPDPQYETILKASSHIVQQEGLDKLTLRKVANQAQCSTMLVYKYFGGKEGLLDALFIEGFEQLIKMQQNIHEDEPFNKLIELCLGYRKVALEFQAHYQIMTLNLNEPFIPSPEARNIANESFHFLCRTAQEFINKHELELSQVRLAQQLFSTCHGWVNLEINGFIWGNMNPAEELKNHIQTILQGHLIKEDRLK